MFIDNVYALDFYVFPPLDREIRMLPYVQRVWSGKKAHTAIASTCASLLS